MSTNYNMYSNSPISEDFYQGIAIRTYSYEIFDSKFFVVLNSDDEPYISMYIDSVKFGNPDKEPVVRKWLDDTKSISSSRIYSLLNNIERQLQPILDIIKRDTRINDILDK